MTKYSTVHHFGDCFFVRLGRTWRLLQCFKQENAVYVRFSYIANFQPKFYLGSTSSFVLCREHSRFRKLQVQQNKLVIAEVALRFWCRYDNFWMWSVLPIYTDKSNFWALEQALIQLWQPRLNTPFIYQFFQLPQRTHHEIQIFVMAEASVDVHTSTCSSSSPQSSFHRQELGSNEVSHGEENPVQRIRTSRLLLHPSPCQKTGETQRSCAINAIDRALKFWKAKPVRRPVPVHAL